MKKDISGSNNVCVRSKDGVYSVLFSRGLSKPHVVVCHTGKDSLESLRLGWLRAIRMVKSQSFTFRTQESFLEMCGKEVSELTETEVAVREMMKERDCTILYRKELKLFSDLMDTKMDRKVARIAERAKANQPE